MNSTAPHAHVGIRPWQKKGFYSVTVVLWASGIVWLWIAQEPLWLKVHGAAAMAFLLFFGSFLFDHVLLGWTQKRQRRSGSSLVVLFSTLTVSGWGLYYLGQENVRQATSVLHSALGVITPLLLLAHIRKSRRP